MSSPWDILGLDSEHRDQRSIKRAYAKLLKQHRPDQDPEGFTRIHEAYQWALRMAEDDDAPPRPLTVSAPARVVHVPVARSEPPPASSLPTSADEVVTASGTSGTTAVSDGVRTTDASTGDPGDGPKAATESSGRSATPPETPIPNPAPAEVVSTEPSVPPTAEVVEPAEKPNVQQSSVAVVLPPTVWEIALIDLERVAGQPDSPLRREAVLVVLRRLAGLVTQRLGDAAVLGTLLNRYLPDGRTQWRLVLDDDDLLEEMRRGRSDLTAHTLRGSFECGDWVRLRQFARRWLEEDADTLQSSDAVALTRVLAVWLAPFDYALADQLVGRLPLAMRRNADNELDTLLAVGRDAAKLPEDSRLYLCHVLVGRTPPENEDVRWRTGGLLSQVASDSMLRRMLNQRATEHFAGLSAPAGTTGSVTMLGVGLGIAGFSLWALLVGLLVAALDPAQVKTGVVLLAIPAAVAMYFALRWVHRRLLPPYQTRWRPWLWRHLGPFDWPLLFMLLYGWIGLGSAVFVQGQTNPGVAVAWLWLAPPVFILLIHHQRRLLRKYPQFFPPWQDIPARITRVQRLFVLDIALLQALRNFVQVLQAIIAASPSALGTAVLIGGLALCPGLSWNDQSEGVVTTLVWSGPAALAWTTLHAWWSRWCEHGRQPRWWPLLLAGGCCVIPGFVWLVAMGPVWIGWRSEPTNGWLVVIALWFIADITYRTWLRYGRRLPAL